jgi:Formate hydrogenlyase subunit 6/NADH:ubiquinone oxidoreductase 23 kD subunit (chain I)
MSIQIYYFTGTGNSLHVAKELQKRVPDTELIPVMGALKNSKMTVTGEIIGLVFPIYFFSIPFPVKEFLNRVDLRPASYIFALATRGGSPCRVFSDMDQLLKKQDKSLDASFFIDMPNNYPLWAPHPYEPETQETIKNNELEMQKKLDSTCKIIVKKQAVREDTHHKPDLKTNILFPFLTFLVHKTRRFHFEKNFYADSKCSGCGICEQVCLAEKIKLENARPVWRKDIRCLFCFACINYCPKRAIQVKHSKTLIRHRYHHAEVGPAEIAAQKRGI